MADTATYTIVAAGTKEGLALLYERYGKRLYGYAVHSWKLTEDEAWDTVYKTLYKVFEATPSYQFASEEKYGSFIFRIFLNYLRNLYKKKKREGEHLELLKFEDESDAAAVSVPVEEEKLPAANMQLLKVELEKLEEWERTLLLLRSQEMPYSEIAAYVHKPADQLKVYYQRLKATLSKRISEALAAQNNTHEKA